MIFPTNRHNWAIVLARHPRSRLRWPVVDGQRQYPADPDRWFADQPDDERGRVPAQRSDDRFGDADAERYDGDTSSRYTDDNARRGGPSFGDPAYGGPPFGDPAYPEAAYADDQPGYGDSEFPDGPPREANFAGGDTSRRRRAARPARVGKRSGLELPDPEAAGYDSGEDSSRYRAERIDRQALRRDGQTYQSQTDGPAFDQPGYDPSDPAQSEQRGRDDRPAGYPAPPSMPQPVTTTYGPSPSGVKPVQVGGLPAAAPLATPTQALPSAQISPAATPAVYLSRRPGVAILLGIAAIVIDLMLLPVLLRGEFAHAINPSGVLGGLFAMIGIPMVAYGLYGLACGAATARGSNPVSGWLRPPLAYLPVGLLLLIAAGLAA